MSAAFEVGKGSGCIRNEHSKTGAVAVRDGQIIASATNGAITGLPSCATRGYCIRTKMNIPSGTMREVTYCLCAEQRIICNCARDGVALNGAEMYVTMLPCAVCIRLIISAGFKRCYYHFDYASALTREIAKEAGFELIQI